MLILIFLFQILIFTKISMMSTKTLVFKTWKINKGIEREAEQNKIFCLLLYQSVFISYEIPHKEYINCEQIILHYKRIKLQLK